MVDSNDNRPAVAIAGASDLAKFFVEELLRDGRYRVVVLSRAKRDWFTRPDISLQVTDYTHSSILSILNASRAIACFCFIHSDDPTFYLGVHNALLSACAASDTCHLLVPSEYGGDITTFPELPRFYAPTHGEFRKILRAQNKVRWTLVNIGWFMDYFLPTEKSYMKPLPGVWPIDLARSKALILGTGEEKIGWTAARDVAKALVRLVEAEDLEELIYVQGEQSTWNAAISTLETYHSRKFTRRVKPTAQIEEELNNPTNSSVPRKVSEMDEWNVTGASAVPWNEVLRQRQKYFQGIKFRSIAELLKDGETLTIV
ncbi:hypothetical protein VTO42DRAFT_1607 [Malbranchea cinnamomea]